MNTLPSNEAINLFLQRWPVEEVYRLTIEDYIDAVRVSKKQRNFASMDTFCYWTEYAFWRAKSDSLRKQPSKDFAFDPYLWKRYGITPDSRLPDVSHFKKEQPKFGNERDSDDEADSQPSDLESVLGTDGFEIYEFDESDGEAPDIDEPDYHVYDDVNLWEKREALVSGKEVLERDRIYTWRSVYGDSAAEAFKNIHKDVIQVVESSIRRDFELARATRLPESFALRIAYLYASDELIPIFRRSVLERCAFALGFISGDSDWASLQRFIIDRRPSNYQDNFLYALHLTRSLATGNLEFNPAPQRQSRASTPRKSIGNQTRRAVESYTVEQRHNLIQNELQRKLVARFGEDVVILEENWVDVKLYLPDEIVFYEVKSDLNASTCIRNALGQLLHYVHLDSDTRKKRLVVIGPVAANEQDRLFIQFLKGSLQLEFDYEWVALPWILESG